MKITFTGVFANGAKGSCRKKWPCQDDRITKMGGDWYCLRASLGCDAKHSSFAPGQHAVYSQQTVEPLLRAAQDGAPPPAHAPRTLASDRTHRRAPVRVRRPLGRRVLQLVGEKNASKDGTRVPSQIHARSGVSRWKTNRIKLTDPPLRTRAARRRLICVHRIPRRRRRSSSEHCQFAEGARRVGRPAWLGARDARAAAARPIHHVGPALAHAQRRPLA